MAKQKTLDMAVERKLDTVERYEFEPIKGYPMLHWKGKRPFRGTQYFPAQLKENHGEPVNGWMNRIYWGDNLQVMSHLLKEFRGKVDLVYIDPPFDSKADYKKTITVRRKTITNDYVSFEEKQYNDLWSNDEYLQFMYERLILLRELMSDKGTIFVQCDSHRNHLIRSIMDEVFGAENFRNEIVWIRSSSGKTMSRNFARDTDTILFYSKGEDYGLFPVYKPLAEATLRMYSMDDGDGRGKYRFYPMQKTSSPGPETTYDYVDNTGKVWPCPPKGWRMNKEKVKALENDGRLYLEGGTLQEKAYWNERPNPGKLANNLWDDIPNLQGENSEMVGYPTQKPEKLVERIISSVTVPNDLVLDCFMGSGTTQSVASKLGRRCIGADINLGAIQTTTKRLLGVSEAIRTKPPQIEFGDEEDGGKQKVDTFYTGFSVYNVNQYDIFRNELEAKELLIQALEIQPLPGNNLYDGEKDGRMVKVMPVNRIATRADLSTLIANFDYKEFDKRKAKAPNKPVESLYLVCMGHEPDLKAALKKEVPYELDVEVVDILRDKQDLQFKRESVAKVVKKKDELVIEQFYPMNLLQKLSVQKETVEDWRELVESVMVDWNYDGGVFEPKLVDVPDKNELVKGRYVIPKDAGTIKVKITDLLSESLELELR